MSPAHVEMYLTQWCPYCQRARALLRARGVHAEEIDIDEQPERRAEMIGRAGRRTVPQIFINGRHIGGSDDLHALDAAGQLVPLLASHKIKEASHA
jgi:glutaredoxin 3